MDDQPEVVFCEHCGAQLRKKVKRRCFDAATGKPLYELRFQCPNWRWYRPSHARYWHGRRMTPDGDKYYELFSEKDLPHNGVRKL